LYVLLAHHDTGHGLSTDVVLITSDRLLAIGTARIIENFGYQFYSQDAGVFLLLIEESAAIAKDRYEITGNIIPAAYPIQRIWRKKDGTWTEQDLIPGATYPQPF
jgi:hypothetical protein